MTIEDSMEGDVSVYLDGVKILDTTSVSYSYHEDVLSDHFKSVKLNGKEILFTDFNDVGSE